jgi:DNA polymerase I-like protein with 3'-5' exonuclease and polymerase domains
MFIPSPGHFLLAIDFSYIELRTLAAICEAKFGSSKLADTIRNGVDPHCYTAAMMLSMNLEDFLRLEKVEDQFEIEGVVQKKKGYRFKQFRQNAKAVNFGVPGGQGAASLVDYARSIYGVQMTIEQAQEKRSSLINEIYPELNSTDGYLAGGGMAALASALGSSEEECWRVLDWSRTRSTSVTRCVQKIVAGNAIRTDGVPYKRYFEDGVWRALNQLNRNENQRVRELLGSRQGCTELYELLFCQDVATLTGRVRGNAEYTQSKNTPFQSLAADGAKLGLWDLLYHGYRVVGFIHDELLVELPDQGGFVALATCEKIKEIVCNAMAQVTNTVPIDAEYSVSTCWSKSAERIVKDDKVYAWTPNHEKPAQP